MANKIGIAVEKRAARSIRRYLLAGLLIVGVSGIGAGGWAVSTELAGAVVGQGQLVVQSNKKIIQSPVAGVVATIGVDDGAHVKAGDLLVRLDDTQAKANFGAVQKQIYELEAQQARIETEIFGGQRIEFPEEVLSSLDDPVVAHIIDGETNLFNARRASSNAKKQQYTQQISQLNNQIDGMLAQQDADRKQVELNNAQMDNYEQLLKEHLTLNTNVTQAYREAARLSGEVAQLDASIAEARGKIAETQLRIVQIDDDLRSEDGKDLASVRASLGELQSKRISAQQQLDQLEIRAPQEGTVQELALHTPRAVVGAGEAILAIVPEADTLSAEVRVRPEDIDQLYPGQPAEVRFLAFNQRSTPIINGVVERISADVQQDNRTGARYYAVRIGLASDAGDKLDGLKLVPGMPVESYMTTGSRTALSYFTRPVADQVSRAFRDK